MAFVERFVPFWNRKTLEPPSFASLQIRHKNAGGVSGELANDLDKIISVLDDLDLLHFDAALISRLLYRTKKTLRNDKGYKGFQKVHHVLRNYLSLNIVSVIKEVRSVTYNDRGPSKEMLEWCLLNLQRFAALFHRLEKTCTETAYYLHHHITTGNRWHLALLFLACLSRVWTFSRYLLILTCEWYSNLQKYLNCLEPNGQWLPSSYNLPYDLPSLLGNPEFLCKTDRTMQLIEESKNSVISKKASNIRGLLFNEDFGEIVSRCENDNDSTEIKKPEDIEEFLKVEELCRKKKTKSLTSHLNDKEWKYLKNFLKECLKDVKSTKNKNIYLESMNRAHKELRSWLKSNI